MDKSDKVTDGNIAFKVTYVDAEWKGVCSDKAYWDNIAANREWCVIQSQSPDSCRNTKWKNPESLLESSPCYDCQVLMNFEYFSGMAHGPVKGGEALKSRRAVEGKLAIFTSRKHGESEVSRFVFAIAPIVTIEAHPTEGYDIFICDPDRAFIFREELRPRFWRSYSNVTTDEPKWNTGLFRYVSDQIAAHLLQQVLARGKMSAKSSSKIAALLELVK